MTVQTSASDSTTATASGSVEGKVSSTGSKSATSKTIKTSEGSPEPILEMSNIPFNLDGSKFELWNVGVCSQVYLPRYILSFAGATFESRTTEDANDGKTKPKPRLRHILSDDSVFEVQGVTVIARYLARLFHLEGETVRDSALLDMAFSLTTDLVQQWTKEVYDKPNPRSTECFQKFLERAAPTFDALEHLLVKNGSNGYFCNASTTYVDLAYHAIIALLVDCHPDLTRKVLSSTIRPASEKLYRRLKDQPRLQTMKLSDPWEGHSCSRILNLATAGFLSSDIQRSFAFYTDILGLNCTRKEINAQDSKLGTLEFELPGSGTLLSIVATAGTQPRATDAGQGKFTLTVTNVHTMVADLVLKGVKVRVQPEQLATGSRACIYDNDNNQIHLIDRVPGKA